MDMVSAAAAALRSRSAAAAAAAVAAALPPRSGAQPSPRHDQECPGPGLPDVVRADAVGGSHRVADASAMWLDVEPDVLHVGHADASPMHPQEGPILWPNLGGP
ncbi:unnamed protein product [Prorocentrum cordatum]|uniref:Uncharacterized protein n=1 Tax=Prorocentrum cordatum TaxID=2364126 RepID=A0ABN9QFC1_9DINO|nr:unnamed protein product [Polarella glacialis]